MTEGYIFDEDGTIFQTSRLLEPALRNFVQSYGPKKISADPC